MIGIQIGAGFLDFYGDKWEALQAWAAGFVFLWAILVFFFLVPHPEMVGIEIEEMTEKEALMAAATTPEVLTKIVKQRNESNTSADDIMREIRNSQAYRSVSVVGNVPLTSERRIGFWQAWTLPGVMLYGSSFFCTKMAVYCLLFRLPTFFKTVFGYDSHQTANISNLLDFGALIGSMVIGGSSDLLHGKRSPPACVAVILAIIVTFSFVIVGPDYKDMPIGLLLVMMFFLGFCINGLNNVISSACSADLGKQEALKGNARAISTVTGIIDGTGTLGAAVGNLIISFT
jgi:OPA family glycerol-3-phosphate transporter-like MFS transporter 3